VAVINGKSAEESAVVEIAIDALEFLRLSAGETVVRALAGFTRSSARAAYSRLAGRKIKKQLER
jgi:hypothetical protein